MEALKEVERKLCALETDADAQAALLEVERAYQKALGAFPADAANDRWSITQTYSGRLRRYATSLGQPGLAQLALEFLVAALPTAPEQAGAQNQIGLTWTTLGDLSASPWEAFMAARAAYAAALVAAKGHAGAEAFCGRVQINEAISIWQLASSTPDRSHKTQLLGEAEARLDNTLGALPVSPGPTQRVDRPRALQTLGNVLLDLGKTDAAIQAFEQAIPLWGDPRERARTYNELGIAYRQSLDDQSELIYERVPAGPGFVHEPIGRLKDALEAFDKALDDQSRLKGPLDWNRTQYNRAMTLRRLGDALSDEHPEEALKIYEDVLEASFEASDRQTPRSRHPIYGTIIAEIGGTFEQIRVVEQGFDPPHDYSAIVHSVLSLVYYHRSLEYLIPRDKRIIEGRIEQLLGLLDTALGYILAKIEQITLDIERILSRYGIPRAEWSGTLQMVKETVEEKIQARAQASARETTDRAKGRVRLQAGAVDQDAAISDAEAVKLVFGDIPESFRTGTYTRNPHPELVHHPAVLAQAKEIANANRRAKIATLPPAKREQLREARRILQANRRRNLPHPSR